MAVLKSCLLLLLTLSSQVLALSTDQAEPNQLGLPIQGPVNKAFPKFDDISPEPPKLDLTTPAPTNPTPTSTTFPNPAPPAVTLFDRASPEDSTPNPAPTPVQPKDINLRPDPQNPYMAGQPTWFCNYRYRHSHQKDHYTLRGRNWNVTDAQIEGTLKKVVYNTPEWGASPFSSEESNGTVTKLRVGGADKHGEFSPGGNVTKDTVAFRYSETFVADGVTPNGVQEFSAEVSSFLDFLCFLLYSQEALHNCLGGLLI